MGATRTARLSEVHLPDFGRPSITPEIPAALYATRLERLRDRMDGARYDRVVVYADREHSANLAWLTGFDPRFEEAILVVGATGEPAILVGNECYERPAPLPCRCAAIDSRISACRASLVIDPGRSPRSSETRASPAGRAWA
jgi:Xaa-Pro aminopeptidase